jgi:hypothetical protein
MVVGLLLLLLPARGHYDGPDQGADTGLRYGLHGLLLLLLHGLLLLLELVREGVVMTRHLLEKNSREQSTPPLL